MEIREIRDKLFNKLIGTGWENDLRFFVKSSEFDDILLALLSELEKGFRFTPGVNDIFKPFELCHLDKLKVVMVWPEAWLNPTLNHGLAISNNAVDKYPLPFYRFKTELASQVPNHSILEADLTPWAKQGVLLLNESITARITTSSKHFEIWQAFIGNVFDILNRRDNLIFVFIGESYWSEELDERHFKIELPAIPDGFKKVWDSQNLFLEINKKLVEKNLSEIVW